MKDIRTQRGIYTNTILTNSLYIIVISGLLGLSTSCIKVFENEKDLDNNIGANSRILSSKNTYNDILDTEPIIKVLLLKGVKKFNMTISSSFELFFSENNQPSNPTHVSLWQNKTRHLIKKYSKLPNSSVKLDNSHIFVGNEKFERKTMEFVPKNNAYIEINKVRYQGTIRIIPEANGTFLVIEETEIEKFLSGVLGSEMPLSWNTDTLFAQAVAARTFTMYKKKKHEFDTYHINRLDLAYNGISNINLKAENIVEKSKGVIMVHDRKIFPGYFHSTCGGHTEDVYHIFKRKSIKPLSGVPCGYCKFSKHFRWKTDINKKEISKRVYGPNSKYSSSISIKPINLGPGGHAANIEIRNSKNKKTIDANNFRLLIGANKLKSTAFSTRNNGKSLTISGKGWGHGVGLCQYGSQKMSSLGYKWHEILRHYYPGIDFVTAY